MSKREASSPASSAQPDSVVEATFSRRKTERDGGAWAVSSTEDPRLTIVGPMLDPRPGARVRLYGCSKVEHPTFGKQIKYKTYEWIGFGDRRGIAKFLADSCDGVGPRTAERILDAFGDAAIDALRERPGEVAAAVRGLDPEVAAAASVTLHRLERESKVLSTLRGAGLGPKLAQRVVQAYAPDHLDEVLKTDPWSIADVVDGVGFKTADQLALALRHPVDSPLRARSGLRHFVEEAASMDGHVLLTAAAVWKQAAACGIPEAAFSLAVVDSVTRTRVARVMVGESPNLALASLHAAERFVAERALALSRGRAPALDWDQGAVDSYLATKRGPRGEAFVLDPSQVEAVEGVLKRRLVVVTGGPGTGKSAILQAIYAGLSAGNKVRVAAPTGKAAVRLRSDSGIPASTIHLALLREARCGHDQTIDEQRLACRKAGREHRKLDADVIAIDETSMVDSDLMAWLLGALRPDCSVVLFGDVDQLPPVGPGCPFRDIIESGKVPVHRLTTVHRTDRQFLKENAKLINAGQVPRWGDGVEDFFVIERANDGEATAAADAIVEVVARRIPAKYGAAGGFDVLDDVQVIAPMRERGKCGVNPLNEQLRDALNPPTSAPGPRGFRKGDKVIQTKNDYQIGVMNGEIGRVLALGQKGQPVSDAAAEEYDLDVDGSGNARHDWVAADFDHGEPVVYGVEQLDHLALAYAITCHRSQGSQWPYVVVPVVKNHAWMMSRKLLYTAVTRAQKMAILVGEADAIRKAVRNVRDDARDTLVKRWLDSGLVGFEPTNAMESTPSTDAAPARPATIAAIPLALPQDIDAAR